MNDNIFDITTAPQPAYSTPPARPSKYTQEEIVPGVVLDNYIKRQPDEEGKYVLVTTHSERIEKIKQPEEIAAEKRATRIGLAVFGTLAAGFVGLMAYVAYKDPIMAEAEKAKNELRAMAAENERLKAEKKA